MRNTQPQSNQFFGANEMNLSTQTQQTMLSTEIAALTEKQHPHVMRDIRVILGELKDYPNLDSGFFLTEYKAGNGKNEPCYELDYDATMVVLTGYDVIARTKVIKRWQELEQLSKLDPMTLFSDPAAMLQLATNYAKRLIEKDEVIAQQAPKVAALELLSGSEGSLCVRDTANALGIKSSKLSKWMKANKWAYRKIGKNKDLVPYRSRIQSEVLEYSPFPIQLPNGASITKLQMRVTPKGLTKLAEIFSGGAITIGGMINA